jgi:16S rRNA (cytosine1402-N4)-methyltransferase
MLSLARTEEWNVAEPVVHRPVLPGETLALLAVLPGQTVVDATLGPGGHAELLLEAVGPGGRVVGIDRDGAALEIARRRLARFGKAFLALQGNHRELPQLLAEAGVGQVDRVLLDLGVSSLQLDDPDRGFSFRADGPLDMRMDPRSGPTAADLVATLSEEELRQLLWRFGEERRARAVAHAIVGERARRPLRRTGQLAEIVGRALGPAARRWPIHPATRTFQALRIAVNGELDGLGELVERTAASLPPGGRIAVIAFHSLEDREIKQALRRLAQRCTCPPGLPTCGCGRRDLVRLLTRKPVRPSAAEQSENPRSRSARLRAAERL